MVVFFSLLAFVLNLCGQAIEIVRQFAPVIFLSQFNLVDFFARFQPTHFTPEAMDRASDLVGGLEHVVYQDRQQQKTSDDGWKHIRPCCCEGQTTSGCPRTDYRDD